MNRYTPTMIWLVMCLIVVLLNWNCSSTNQHGVEEKHYPLIDTRLRIHKYKENIQWKIFPTHKKSLTRYCSKHFIWEDIKPIYRLVNEEMKWVYRVSRNKKS